MTATTPIVAASPPARRSTRAFATHVSRVQRLSPHFARITLAGEQLGHFGTGGFDQRIKLVLPLPDGSVSEFGLFDEPGDPRASWVARWRALPDALRNPIRTYTVRGVRPERGEIDVDFVLHGTEGPASAWADAAAAGDPLVVVGPDARAEGTGGIEWRPGSAETVLLAGDETAVPAISSILERLGEHVAGLAVLEVPTAEDVIPVVTPSRVEVRWLVRGRHPHGALLAAAVEEWGRGRARDRTAAEELPELGADGIVWDAPTAPGQEYAWLAGESSVITGIRRHLVRELGLDRSSIAFMGYWRLGRAEGS